MTPDAEMVKRDMIDSVSSAICHRRNDPTWPCNGLDFDDEMARAALTALAPDFAALHARIAELEGKNRLLRAVFRVIALRWEPRLSHAEIDAMLDNVLGLAARTPAAQPQPGEG